MAASISCMPDTRNIFDARRRWATFSWWD